MNNVCTRATVQKVQIQLNDFFNKNRQHQQFSVFIRKLLNGTKKNLTLKHNLKMRAHGLFSTRNDLMNFFLVKFSCENGGLVFSQKQIEKNAFH